MKESGGTILVTGGAGFIGGSFVLGLLRAGKARVINLDALTYLTRHLCWCKARPSPVYRLAHRLVSCIALYSSRA